MAQGSLDRRGGEVREPGSRSDGSAGTERDELRIEQPVARPGAVLAPYVSSYVGYRLQGFPPGTHAGLPSRHLTFIVSFDAPLDLAAMPDPTQPPARLWAMVGGLHASPATIRHDGNQHGVQLRLTPLGARVLLGARASDLVQQVVPLEAVLAHRAAELVDRLACERDWASRFAVLDDVLTSSIAVRPAMRREVAHAWRRLCATDGAIDIDSLADEVGWSRRHLTEQFGLEYGLAPKTIARVMRFEAAKALLGSGRVTSLADLAAASGYADQSHLTRDWKQFAGTTPAAWVRNESLPFVQDEIDLAEAG